MSLETEVARARAALAAAGSDFERHRLMMALKETNRAAFYALLQGPDLEALLRIVYTPTIGAMRKRRRLRQRGFATLQSAMQCAQLRCASVQPSTARAASAAPLNAHS